MSLYFQSIGLSLAPKSLESGNLTKLSLLPININFQLLIPVLGNKDEQLNKHLGSTPWLPPRHIPPPSESPAPSLHVVPVGRRWGSVCCNSLSFAAPHFLLCGSLLAAISSGCTSSSVMVCTATQLRRFLLGGFPSLLTHFSPGLLDGGGVQFVSLCCFYC